MILDIVMMADRRYVAQIGVVMDSACRHLRRDAARFHVLDYGMDDASWKALAQRGRRLRRSGGIVRHPRESLAGLSAPETLKRICLDRLRSLDELAGAGPRIVFLDLDLLVHRDVGLLGAMDLKGKPVAAVRDFGMATLSAALPKQDLGALHDAPYFNIGVMVIDLPRWRNEDWTARCLDRQDDLGPEYEGCIDQDLMNLALVGRWHDLDLRWNAQAIAVQHHALWPETDLKARAADLLPELRRRPWIRHWPGRFKPWMRLPGCRIHGRISYAAAAARSGWFRAALGIPG